MSTLRHPPFVPTGITEPTGYDDSFDVTGTLEDSSLAENLPEENDAPYPAEIRVEKEQYSFFELKRMLNEFKELILNPEFQRLFVWTPQQKSELIESLLMGIPLPFFYFAKNSKGIISVVDGLQRLNTVFSYMEDGFTLGPLKYLPQHRGKRFSQLERPLQAKIEKYQIMVYVIGAKTDEHVKLDIFDRINRGGTPLNKQEMRNALYVGNCTRLLAELTNENKENPFILATGNRLNKSRMRDRYLVLRFFSFYLWLHKDVYHLDSYNISLALTRDFDDFLARYMRIMNEMPDDKLEELRSLFHKSMKIAYQLYGDAAFTRDHDPAKPINMVLFESLTYCFAMLPENQLLYTTSGLINEDQKNALKGAVADLVAQPFFQSNLNRSPNSMKRLTEQFEHLERALPALRKVLC